MPRNKRAAVHFVSSSFPGGASFSAHPDRKPYVKKGKKKDIFSPQDDPDLVCYEFFSSANDFKELPDQSRLHVSGVLANRINARRALRELVLPQLEAIQKSLDALHARLDRLESPASN